MDPYTGTWLGVITLVVGGILKAIKNLFEENRKCLEENAQTKTERAVLQERLKWMEEGIKTNHQALATASTLAASATTAAASAVAASAIQTAPAERPSKVRRLSDAEVAAAKEEMESEPYTGQERRKSDGSPASVPGLHPGQVSG